MRKLSVPIYLAALVITVIIFAAGVYIGTVVDKANADSIQAEVESTNQLVLSSQLMLLLGDSTAFCPFYSEQLAQLDRQTEQVGMKVAYMEDIKGLTDPELKKQYFMLETNAFLLSQKVSDRCGANFTTILYFYSNKNCSTCAQQGYELISLRQRLGEKVRVYSFDGELGSSLVEALKNRYAVRSYPTLVMDGNRTISGFTSTDGVQKQIS